MAFNNNKQFLFTLRGHTYQREIRIIPTIFLFYSLVNYKNTLTELFLSDKLRLIYKSMTRAVR